MIKKYMLWILLSMSVGSEAMERNNRSLIIPTDIDLPSFPEQDMRDAVDKLAMQQAYQNASPVIKMMMHAGAEQTKSVKGDVERVRKTVANGIGAVLDTQQAVLEGQQETTRTFALGLQNQQQTQEDILRAMQEQNRMLQILLNQNVDKVGSKKSARKTPTHLQQKVTVSKERASYLENVEEIRDEDERVKEQPTTSAVRKAKARTYFSRTSRTVDIPSIKTNEAAQIPLQDGLARLQEAAQNVYQGLESVESGMIAGGYAVGSTMHHIFCSRAFTKLCDRIVSEEFGTSQPMQEIKRCVQERCQLYKELNTARGPERSSIWQKLDELHARPAWQQFAKWLPKKSPVEIEISESGAERLARVTTELYQEYQSPDRTTPYSYEFHKREKELLEKIAAGEFADGSIEMDELQEECAQLCVAAKEYHYQQTQEAASRWNAAVNAPNIQQWLAPYQQNMKAMGLSYVDSSLIDQVKALWLSGAERLQREAERVYCDANSSLNIGSFSPIEKELFIKIARGDFADNSEMRELSECLRELCTLASKWSSHCDDPERVRARILELRESSVFKNWYSPYENFAKRVYRFWNKPYVEFSHSHWWDTVNNSPWEPFEATTNTVQVVETELLQQELAELHSFYQTPSNAQTYSDRFYRNREELLKKIASEAFCDGSREMYDLQKCASEICRLATRFANATSPEEKAELIRRIQHEHTSPAYVRWFVPHERAMHERGQGIMYPEEVWRSVQQAGHVHESDENCCSRIESTFNCVQDVAGKVTTAQCIWNAAIKPLLSAVGCPASC